MCAAVSVMVCYRGRGREIVICALLSVMVFYKLGDMKGNGDMCAVSVMVCYGGEGGKW